MCVLIDSEGRQLVNCSLGRNKAKYENNAIFSSMYNFEN